MVLRLHDIAIDIVQVSGTGAAFGIIVNRYLHPHYPGGRVWDILAAWLMKHISDRFMYAACLANVLFMAAAHGTFVKLVAIKHPLHLILFVVFCMSFLAALALSQTLKEWRLYLTAAVQTEPFRDFLFVCLVCLVCYFLGFFGDRYEYFNPISKLCRPMPPLVLAVPGVMSAIAWAASTTDFPPNLNMPDEGYANSWNVIAAAFAAVAVGMACSGISVALPRSIW